MSNSLWCIRCASEAHPHRSWCDTCGGRQFVLDREEALRRSRNYEFALDEYWCRYCGQMRQFKSNQCVVCGSRPAGHRPPVSRSAELDKLENDLEECLEAITQEIEFVKTRFRGREITEFGSFENAYKAIDTKGNFILAPLVIQKAQLIRELSALRKS